MRKNPSYIPKDIPDNSNGAQKTSTQVKLKTRQIISDELFIKLKLLIGDIKTLKKIIYSGNKNEELINNLENYLNFLINSSDQKTKNEFAELLKKNEKNKIKKDFKQKYVMENENCLFYYDIYPSQELRKIVFIHNGIQRLKFKTSEFNFFKKNPNIFEVENIDNYYENKIKQTDEKELFIKIFGDPIEILKAKKGEKSKKINFKNIQYRRLQSVISKNNISNGIFENLGLSFFIDNETYKKITQDNSNGSHYPNTIISLIKKIDGKDINKTIHHEQKHNILEAFLPNISIEDYSFFGSSLNRIQYLIDYNASAVIINSEEKEIFNKIKKFFDSSIIELICDFDVLFNGENTTAFSGYNKLIKILSNDIEKINKSKYNEEYKVKLLEVLPRLLEKIIQYYKKIYKELADFLFVAEKSGMKDELFALLLIYQPSNFIKIRKFFERKLGKEEYGNLVFARQIIKPQFFKIPKEDDKNPVDKLFYAIFQIKRTYSAHEIEEFSIFDSNKLREINNYKSNNNDINIEIKNAFLRKNYDGFIRENKITNVLKLEELLFELIKYFKKIGLKEDEINQIENQIWDDFDFYIYEEIMEGKYSMVFDILNNISEENDFFIKNITESLKDEYEENLDNTKLKKAIVILKNHERSSEYFNQ